MTQFVLTGRLGPIALGISRAAVEDELGGPNDWSIRRDLYRYGPLQIGFTGDLVNMIVVEFMGHHPAIETPAFLLAEVAERGWTNRSSVLSELGSAGVLVAADPRLTFEGSQSAYLSDIGAWLIFDKDHRLAKVGLGPK